MIPASVLYYGFLVLLFVFVLYGTFKLLPKKKYRSWALLKQDTEEKKTILENDKSRRGSRLAFLKYFRVEEYIKEAARFNWDVSSRAPLILYGNALVGLCIGYYMQSPIVMAIGVFAGFWGPWFYLQLKRNKYEEYLEEQVEILIQSVAAGYSIKHDLTQAMESTTNNLEEPLRSKWKTLMAEYMSGRPLNVLLKKLEEDLPVKEFKEFSSVLQVVEENGGEASDTMKEVAEVIQNRRVRKEELTAEMAQQRQAHRFNIIIAGLIIALFRWVVPDQYALLMNSFLGQALLTCMCLYILWSIKAVQKLTKI